LELNWDTWKNAAEDAVNNKNKQSIDGILARAGLNDNNGLSLVLQGFGEYKGGTYIAFSPIQNC